MNCGRRLRELGQGIKYHWRQDKTTICQAKARSDRSNRPLSQAKVPAWQDGSAPEKTRSPTRDKAVDCPPCSEVPRGRDSTTIGSASIFAQQLGFRERVASFHSNCVRQRCVRRARSERRHRVIRSCSVNRSDPTLRFLCLDPESGCATRQQPKQFLGVARVESHSRSPA